jgi:hypothetical protein
MAPHKFLNKLQQQLFIYRHEYSDFNKIGASITNNTNDQLKAFNYSVKFVLTETDLLVNFNNSPGEKKFKIAKNAYFFLTWNKQFF